VKLQTEESNSRGELRADGALNSSMEESSEARGLSQTIRDPARRKRGASQLTKSRANGHGGESSSLTESPNEAKTNGKLDGSSLSAPRAGLPEREPAASDDATGTTPAGDAATPSAAACAGRDACAEVAAPRSRSSAVRGEESETVDDRRPRAPDDVKTKSKTAASANANQEAWEYPPGTGEPLALDAPGFVEQMHERVNLYEVYKTLLTSGDLKVQQRAAEFLMEMRYGRGAPAGEEEVPRIDFGDLPRPPR